MHLHPPALVLRSPHATESASPDAAGRSAGGPVGGPPAEAEATAPQPPHADGSAARGERAAGFQPAGAAFHQAPARRAEPVWEYGPAILVEKPVYLARYGLCIGGRLEAPASGPAPVISPVTDAAGDDATRPRYRVVHAPATGHTLAEVAIAGPADVARAVDAAVAAFPAWAALAAEGRAERLLELAEALHARASEVAAIAAEESGRPLRLCREEDLAVAEHALRVHAGWARRPDAAAAAGLVTGWDGLVRLPAAIPGRAAVAEASRCGPRGVVSIVLDEPVGLLATAMLWLAPALGAGNAVVFVPPPEASLVALRLAELAHEAGFPPGVFNVLTIDRLEAMRQLRGGPEGSASAYERVGLSALDREEGSSPIVHPVVRAIAAHERVDLVAYGGPARVGDLLAKVAAGAETWLLHRPAGYHAIAVFEDGPLDEAVEVIMRACFTHHGHPIAHASRLLVQESILGPFLRRLEWRMGALRTGDPLDENTDVGPIAAAEAHAATLESLRRAHFEGVAISTGGCSSGLAYPPSAPGLPSAGPWMRPSLLKAIGPSHAAAREPLEGPLVPVLSFRTPTEAVERLNNTPHAFAAGLFAHQTSLLQMLSERVESTLRWWNTFGAIDAARPTLLARSPEHPHAAPMGGANAFAAFLSLSGR